MIIYTSFNQNMQRKVTRKWFLRMTDLIRFAHMYCASKRSDCYEHWILNITSQLLKIQWKIVYDAIYSCSTSSIHTLRSACICWPCYNLTLLKYAFQHFLHAQMSLRDVNSSVLSFIFAQVIYIIDLHR